MSEKTYMVVDPRRDHSFRIPRPDLSSSLETPNACNNCHADRTTEWAADAVVRWYGAVSGRNPHYGEVLAAGRNLDVDAGSALSELATNPDVPGIVRATALEFLGRYGREALPALSSAIRDSDPLVRVAAVRSLEPFAPEERLRRLPLLLEDPVRAVRLEAARLLGALPVQALSLEDRAILSELVAEYESVQKSLADTASANLNLGILHMSTGSVERAVEDYQRALDVQPDFTPASLNLATLLNEVGDNGRAYLVLRDAVARHPEEGEIHYSMGLLLAEMGQFEQAVDRMAQSVKLLPDRSRVRYNFGLALQQLERREEAGVQLNEAHRLDPTDPAVVQALAAYHARGSEWEEAIDWAEELVRMLPGNSSAQQFLLSIRRQSQNP